MRDYRQLFARHSDYASDTYKQDRSQVHARSAERLLRLARTQGAVYVKIGQHVASMNHAVPPEFTNQLKLLEDRAASRPFWQIQRVINREIGGVQTFSEFERVPVAAASLAQVHRARLKESDELVAVKVQYPGLESLVRSDLTCIRILSWLMSWTFPFFDMHWVVDQFKKNLDKELDFLLEAASANRTAAFFEGDSRAFVPRVHEDLSTRRLLVMDFIDGFRVDDVDAMGECGIQADDVAQAVVEVFAQMIFMNGFVHCDPHAGNMMVRPKASAPGGFELFLLDHGLYRELDDEFRRSYCKLWKGLVLRKAKDVEEACAEMGAPGFANVFSVFLINRSWSSAQKLGTDLTVKMSKKELRQLRTDIREGGLKSQSDISDFVERIPDDLLLVFKMNSLVRNVNKALGAGVNRFKVNARYAVRGLRWFNEKTGDDAEHFVVAGTHIELSRGIQELFEGLVNWLGGIADRVNLEMRLFVIDVALWVVRRWYGDYVSSENGGMEGGLIG